jgi:hypothetical protein
LGIVAAATGLVLAVMVAAADFVDQALWVVLTPVIGFGFAGLGLFRLVPATRQPGRGADGRQRVRLVRGGGAATSNRRSYGRWARR